MLNKALRRSLLCSTIVISTGLVAAPSWAQAADAAQGIAPEQAAPAPNSEIVVTGSRIARADLAASSPVTTISAEALKANNTTTVEQLLNTNPQFVPEATSASNNPGDGAATVNLRGLGSKRTLVLIDGKRAPYYSTTGAVDVNIIPTALIKRVDVLTGGASAVYGSDAIAGVVNFVLDDRFVGLKADASSQLTTRGDGATYDASLTGGLKLGDRGNIVASGGYSKRKGVKFGARNRDSVALSSKDLVSSGGSSNGIPTIFDLGNGSQVQVAPDGGLSEDLQLYNFNPVNYAQVPLERYNGMVLGRYEVTDNIEAYGRASYEHTKVVTNLAPTATAGYTFNIDPNNPFLSDAERAAFFGPGAVINDGSGVADDPTARAGTSVVGIRRRIVETGGRLEDHTTKSYQLVGGFRGTIGSDLNWDVFAQYGNTKRHELLKNDLSYSALQQALDVVQGPNGPQCFDQSNGCVPLNVFGNDPLTKDQLAFVLRNAEQNTKTTQFITGGTLSGNLSFLQSPFAAGPAAFSIGAEYRREKSATKVSDDYASGDLIYYGQGQNVAGKYNVKELYLELKMPLVEDKPFVRALNIETGFRYSDYSTVGSVYSYKAGGDWTPVEGVRFRGIYQRAVRAPNISELFSPVVGGTGNLAVDPCAGPSVTPDSTLGQICIAQGAPRNVIGSIPGPISGQINVFAGGNTKLKAEKSDTYTVGVVITPPSIRGFSLSVDYYNIVIGNAIDTTPAEAVLNQCISSGDPTSDVCQSIKRNTLNGSLSGNLQFGVPNVYNNIAAIKTDGIDVTAGYHGGVAAGFHYALTFSGTYTLNYTKGYNGLDGVTKCAGHFGAACDGLEPISHWKHVAGVNLGFKDVTLETRWRFLSSVSEDAGTQILKSKIPSFSYFDETVSFDINKQLNFRLGIQNMFDKKPPIVGDTVGNAYNAGSTFPGVYDVLGRTVFAGVSMNF